MIPYKKKVCIKVQYCKHTVHFECTHHKEYGDTLGSWVNKECWNMWRTEEVHQLFQTLIRKQQQKKFFNITYFILRSMQ